MTSLETPCINISAWKPFLRRSKAVLNNSHQERKQTFMTSAFQMQIRAEHCCTSTGGCSPSMEIPPPGSLVFLILSNCTSWLRAMDVRWWLGMEKARHLLAAKDRTTQPSLVLFHQCWTQNQADDLIFWWECAFATRKLDVIVTTGPNFALIYIISKIPLTSMKLPGYK